MDFGDLILLIIGGIAGYVYREIILFKDLVKITKHLNKKLHEEHVMENKISIREIKNLKHEIVNEIHYFYSADAKFVCQGSTLENAAKNFTMICGKDNSGCFTHFQLNKKMYFINDECVENFPNE